MTGDAAGEVLHWYDFLCPFCYIAQHRNAVLVRHGVKLIELAFQIHPEIPDGGVAAGPRTGPMYAGLEREAADAGLPLVWPPRLPNSRPALAAAEWVRLQQPLRFAPFQRSLFAAHFADREDIEDRGTIERRAGEVGVDVDRLGEALADGMALAMVSRSEQIGRAFGVRSTPSWLFGDRLASGLLAPAAFEGIARDRSTLG